MLTCAVEFVASVAVVRDEAVKVSRLITHVLFQVGFTIHYADFFFFFLLSLLFPFIQYFFSSIFLSFLVELDSLFAIPLKNLVAFAECAGVTGVDRHHSIVAIIQRSKVADATVDHGQIWFEQMGEIRQRIRVTVNAICSFVSC